MSRRKFKPQEPRSIKNRLASNKPQPSESYAKLLVPTLGLSFSSGVLLLWAFQYPVVRSGVAGDFVYTALITTLLLNIFITPLISKYLVDKSHNKFKTTLFATLLFDFFIGAAIVSGLTIANAVLDEGIERSRKAYVVNKYRGGRSKSKATYKFVVSDWNKPDDLYEMSVNRDFYESKKIGEPLFFTTKPGALGHEWILRIE
jgi:hypothetical protein